MTICKFCKKNLHIFVNYVYYINMGGLVAICPNFSILNFSKKNNERWIIFFNKFMITINYYIREPIYIMCLWCFQWFQFFSIILLIHSCLIQWKYEYDQSYKGTKSIGKFIYSFNMYIKCIFVKLINHAEFQDFK